VGRIRLDERDRLLRRAAQPVPRCWGGGGWGWQLMKRLSERRAGLSGCLLEGVEVGERGCSLWRLSDARLALISAGTDRVKERGSEGGVGVGVGVGGGLRVGSKGERGEAEGGGGRRDEAEGGGGTLRLLEGGDWGSGGEGRLGSCSLSETLRHEVGYLSRSRSLALSLSISHFLSLPPPPLPPRT
jgi:hypothetical protein